MWGIGRPIPPITKMDNQNYYLILIYIFLISVLLLFFPVLANEECTENVDCLESINENTYNIDDKLNDIIIYLSIDTSDSISIISSDIFEQTTSGFTRTFGLTAGLLLFSLSFTVFGLFLYKR